MQDLYPLQRRVTEGAWMLFTTLLLIGLEVVAASAGFLLSGGFLLAFFLTATYSWRSGLLWGGVACVCVEILLARDVTLLPALVLVVLAARAWRENGDCVNLLNQVVPGACLGASYGALVVLLENTTITTAMTYLPWMRMLQVTGLATLAGAIALPVLVAFFDAIADRLEINQYHRRAYFRSTSSDDD